MDRVLLLVIIKKILFYMKYVLIPWCEVLMSPLPRPGHPVVVPTHQYVVDYSIDFPESVAKERRVPSKKFRLRCNFLILIFQFCGPRCTVWSCGWAGRGCASWSWVAGVVQHLAAAVSRLCRLQTVVTTPGRPPHRHRFTALYSLLCCKGTIETLRFCKTIYFYSTL